MLIAFEFFYMASPFALYFYSVYRPALNLINRFPGSAWLASFFLPHVVVETSSPLVNAHNAIGAVLAAVGFLAFCIGAIQVYYHKLARKGAVTGGIYNIIRHPQYASFVLCSFGLLWLWPRFLVLILFVTMLFAYYFLAKVEEKECEERFGQSYLDYKNRTNMFLPFRILLTGKLPGLPKSTLGKVLSVAGLYAFTVLVAVGLARAVQSLTLDSLYGIYTKDAATISVGRIETEKLERIVQIALSNEEVRERLATIPTGSKFVNYVLPTTWYVSEVPMERTSETEGHYLSQEYDANLYKIIFVQVDLRTEQEVEGKEILLNAIGRTPITEVWVDISQGIVIDIKTPLVTANYEDVHVPVY
jgi:protein-S-isoprenylcysteine O-methyltransferase Ste14